MACLLVDQCHKGRAARGLLHDFGEVDEPRSRARVRPISSRPPTTRRQIPAHEPEKARPDFGFIREVRRALLSKDGEHRWLVDPLDGTTNFLHGPHFCINTLLKIPEAAKR
jgi:myo-inositol-1(or 4)-monophosphatase